MENNSFQDRIIKLTQQKIASIKFEEDLLKENNTKVNYTNNKVVTKTLPFSIIIIIIIAILIFSIYSYYEKTNLEKNFSKVKTNETENTNTQIKIADNENIDVILYNDSIKISESNSYIGYPRNENLNDKFKFINDLVVPAYLNDGFQQAVYKDKEYNDLIEYLACYKNDNSEITIFFTLSDKNIMQCENMIFPKEIEESIINDHNIKLFKMNNSNNKFYAIALLEYNGYKFYINAVSLNNENDFLNLLKSLLK